MKKMTNKLKNIKMIRLDNTRINNKGKGDHNHNDQNDNEVKED